MRSEDTLVQQWEGSSARLLGLSANLLPPEVVERHRIGRVRWLVVTTVVAVAAMVVAGYGFARHDSALQQDQLDAAGTQSLSLTQQRTAYNELLRDQKQTTLITGQLATLLATDVQWATLFAAVRAAQPKGLALNSLAVALADQTATGAGTSSATTASGLPSADGSTPIGSLTIGGTSATKSAIASYVDAVGAIAGVGNTLLAGVTDSGTTDEVTDFTLRADLTKAALSHHYSSSTSTSTSTSTSN